jgi:hypothetical protein
VVGGGSMAASETSSSGSSASGSFTLVVPEADEDSALEDADVVAAL